MKYNIQLIIDYHRYEFTSTVLQHILKELKFGDMNRSMFNSFIVFMNYEKNLRIVAEGCCLNN